MKLEFLACWITHPGGTTDKYRLKKKRGGNVATRILASQFRNKFELKTANFSKIR